MSQKGQSQPNWAVRATSGFHPIATELRTSLEVRVRADFVAKVFLGCRTKILRATGAFCARRCEGPYRLIQNLSRTSVVALKSTQQQRGLKINFREIFRVVRFSTFATKSARSGHSPGRGSNRRTYMISAVLQPLWRGYAAVVGGIIIVAVSASDRRRSTVVAWCVIGTGRGSADGSSTDAYRHSTAHGCTTVNATAINTTVINASATNANASSICEGVS
jgi:hypothetical protein